MLKTALYEEHLLLNAKMVEFAGYLMPVHYNSGVIYEHNWTRTHTGVFDVSHMGVVEITGPDALGFMEFLTPGKYSKDARCKYTVMLNESGGIVDDLIATRLDEHSFSLVVNASRKDVDLKHMKDLALKFGGRVDVSANQTKAIIAVQGNESEEVLKKVLSCELAEMSYMSAIITSYKGDKIIINRTGYTGEDGFEILLPSEHASDFWRTLLAETCVRPIGLAARDGLRLEAGYPLYGSDLDETISPLEASMGWLISSSNTGFHGNERVLREKAEGISRKRVGLVLNDKGVLRSGFRLYNDSGTEVGWISSGGYSPVLKRSVGLGYLSEDHKNVTTQIYGKTVSVEVSPFPFVPSKVRKTAKTGTT